MWDDVHPGLIWARAPVEAFVRGLCSPSFRFQVVRKAQMSAVMHGRPPQCSFILRLDGSSLDGSDYVHFHVSTAGFLLKASWGSRDKPSYLRRCRRDSLPRMRKLGVDLACRLFRRQLPVAVASVLAE